jgi:hypothetical protein
MCLLALAFALPARASDTTLTGRVIDENDVAVASARITLRSAAPWAQDSTEIRVFSDPIGAFAFRDLAPGAYRIDVEQSGFFALKDRAVDLHEGGNEIVLTLNHIRNTSSTVNVSSTPSSIEPEQTASERRLSGQEIFDVPYPSTHDLRNAMPLIPGVLMDPTGVLHFDGGAENQVLYTLDGFNIGDPLSGTLAAHLPVDSVQSLNYASGRYSPEFGKGSSGTLAIRTESGDDRFRYSGTDFIPGFDTSNGPHIGAYTPRVGISGPIVKEHAWFADTMDGQYSELIVPGLPGGQNTATTYAASNLLHAQVNLTPSNILFGEFLATIRDAPDFGLSPLDPLNTTIDERGRQFFFSLKDQIYLTRGMLLEFGFGGNWTFAREIPQGDALYIFAPNGRQGNYYIDSTQRAARKQVLANMYLPSFRWAGTHQLKTGVDGDRLDYNQNTRRTGIDYLDTNGGLLRTVTFGGSGVLSRPSLEAASYLVDEWKVKPNLFIQAGVREDWDELTRDIVVTPRISFAYQPFGWKNTKITGGYAVITDANTPQLFSQPLDQYSIATTYNPGGGVASGPALSVFLIDNPHLKTPRYENWSAGLDQLLPVRIHLNLNVLRRRSTDGLVYINTLAPDAAPPVELAALYRTSDFAAIYNLENVGSERYDSAQMILRQQFGAGYGWMVSYTRSLASSNAVYAATVDQPALISDNSGRLSWDSPNRFLSWGYLPTFWKAWAVGYLLEVRDGFPFSIMQDTGQIIGAPNSYRFPTYVNLNLSLEYKFHLWRQRWALRGGLNNLTSHQNPTTVDNTIGSPQFLTNYGSTGRHFVARIRWLGKE